jgi:hypothetical protein
MENLGIDGNIFSENKREDREIERIIEREISKYFRGEIEKDVAVNSWKNYSFLAGMKAAFSILRQVNPETSSNKIVKTCEKYLRFYPINRKK